jgi:copper chaperone CopZ
MKDIREYRVSGMTCAHCVQTVQTEVVAVPGVEVASANLSLGLLTVGGDGYSDDAVRDAIREAGYEVG